jgi:hypothetical protein
MRNPEVRVVQALFTAVALIFAIPMALLTLYRFSEAVTQVIHLFH